MFVCVLLPRLNDNESITSHKSFCAQITYFSNQISAVAQGWRKKWEVFQENGQLHSALTIRLDKPSAPSWCRIQISFLFTTTPIGSSNNFHLSPSSVLLSLTLTRKGHQSKQAWISSWVKIKQQYRYRKRPWAHFPKLSWQVFSY